MIRVLGPHVYFYSHRFDDKLLDCIAYKEEPPAPTQIQRYVPIVNGERLLELSLATADHRQVIIENLDAIQQILDA